MSTLVTIELLNDAEILDLGALHEFGLDRLADRILPTELLRLVRLINRIKSLTIARGPIFSGPDPSRTSRKWEAEQSLRQNFGLRCSFSNLRSSDPVELIEYEGDLSVADLANFQAWATRMRTIV